MSTSNVNFKTSIHTNVTSSDFLKIAISYFKKIISRTFENQIYLKRVLDTFHKKLNAFYEILEVTL
jgi:hypothetical protein